MARRGKLIPNLDRQSTKALNLTVLRRYDSFVEEILMTAAHVTLYVFDVGVKQWSRKDVEGSFFVVKRYWQNFGCPPYAKAAADATNSAVDNTTTNSGRIVIISIDEYEKYLKLSSTTDVHEITATTSITDNLVEDILGDFEYEVQVPYILYRNADQEINGIWFYYSHDCEAVSNLFRRIFIAYSRVPPKTKVSSTKREFEELEAVPNPSVIEGPLERPISSLASSITDDTPDDSFVSFFRDPTSAGNVSGSASIMGQQNPVYPCIPLSYRAPYIIPSAGSTVSSAASNFASPIHDAKSVRKSGNYSKDLVKPSDFFRTLASSALLTPPASPSIPPPLLSSVTMQPSHGTPLLQPYPPPAPSSYLNPNRFHGTVITRDKVHHLMLRLVQNNDFIDMVCREMLNAH